MIESNNPEIDSEVLMRQIQEELAQRDKYIVQALLSPAELRSSAPLPRLLKKGAYPNGAFDLSEFLVFQDEAFIDNAFWGVLGREPDRAGKTVYLTGLRQGRFSQVDVLGRLRFSREGLKRRVRIRGLLTRYLISRFLRLPVLGYFLSLLWWLVRLPSLARDIQRMDAYLHYQENRTRERFEAMEEKVTDLRRWAANQVEKTESTHSKEKNKLK